LAKVGLRQWRQYGKVVVGQKDNIDDWKMTQLQYMDTSTKELLDYLRPKLVDFVAQWQEKVQKCSPKCI
jgi:hypothetical protein